MPWSFNFLRFLKRDAERKIEEIENVHLKDLEGWLSARTQEVILNSGLNSEAVDYINILKDKRWILESQLDDWESKMKPFGADWIDYDLKEIKSLFQETRKFLELLAFPENIALENVLSLNSSLEPKIKLLLQKAAGSDFTNSFNLIFNEDDVDNINNSNTNNKINHKNKENKRNKKGSDDNLTENSSEPNNLPINPLLKELTELEKTKTAFEQKVASCSYGAVKLLAQKITLLKNCTTQIEQLERELRSKQERQVIADSKKQEQEMQIAELKQEPGYVSLSSLKQKRTEILKQIEENKDFIFIFFSKLKPLLRRYKDFEKELVSVGINPVNSQINSSNNSPIDNHLTSSQLIDVYLNDPVSAFINDQDLSIKPILKQLRAVLNEERFSLSSKETNLLLEFLDKVEGDYLNKLQQNQLQLTKELQLIGWSHTNTTILSKVEDLEYRLEHFSRQIDTLAAEIRLVEEKINQLKEQRANELNVFQSQVETELHRKVVVGF